MGKHVFSESHSNRVRDQIRYTYVPKQGLARSYTTRWIHEWRTWEHENPQDIDGNPIRCERVTAYDGTRTRLYFRDSDLESHCLSSQWERDIARDPANTDHMIHHWIGRYSLNRLSHLPAEKFAKAVNSMGLK
jgi:hypothetical protein